MTKTSDNPGLKTHSAIGGIGDRLRHMFDSVAADRMPDHLLALVDQLEAGYFAPRAAEEETAAEPIPG